MEQARSLGVDPLQLHKKLLNQIPSGAAASAAPKANQNLQRELTAKLLAVKTGMFNVNLDHRLRWKMRRWKLEIPIGILCRCLPPRFVKIRGLTTPRVQAAFSHTLFNGWTTEARFQRVGPCVLGCSCTAEDRIEHYVCCPHFAWLITSWFGLHQRHVSLASFLMVADNMSDEEMALIAVAVYAMHRGTAFYRNQQQPNMQQIRDFLQHTCQTAVREHPKAAKIFDHATRLRHRSSGQCGRKRSRSPRPFQH